MNPRVVVTGEPFAAWAAEIPPLAADLLARDGELWVARSAGVLGVDGRLLAVLPRGHAPPADPVAAVFAFAAALLRYRRDPARRSVERGTEALRGGTGRDGERLDALEAALLLWSDYAANGPLVVSESVIEVDTPGRVHWARTLRDGAPTDGPGGPSVLGHRTVRSRRIPQNPLTLLHRSMAEGVGARLGLGPPPALPVPPPRTALPVVREGLRRAFADRPRRVLAWMAQILEDGRATSGFPERHFVLVVRDFAPIWERMLQVALGHVPTRDGLSGDYHGPDGQRSSGVRLVPDLLMHWGEGEGRALLVLDAKDYGDGTWPATHDVTKQMLYRLLLSAPLHAQGLPPEKVGNAFLFPGAANPVARRGEHRLRNEQGRPGEPGRVVCLTVDLPTVMGAYRAGRPHAGLRAAVAAEVLGGSGTTHSGAS